MKNGSQIIKLLKNVGITTGAIVGTITLVKVAAVIIELPSRMNRVDNKLELVNKNIKLIENKVDSIGNNVSSQKNQIKNLTDSYSEFLKNNPSITKEDLIYYLKPIFEEVKKNELRIQPNAFELGAS